MLLDPPGPGQEPIAGNAPGARPHGWGDDPLSRFIETAFFNRLATFGRQRDRFQALGILDGLQRKLAGNVDGLPQVPLQLALKGHSGFMVACEHALAGQFGAVFPTVRSMLEHYALAADLCANPARVEVWAARHKDAASLKAAKAVGGHDTMEKAVRGLDATAGALWEDLYQTCIDQGAHPNVQGIAGNMMVVDFPEGAQGIYQLTMHGAGPELDTGLAFVEDAAACAVQIIMKLFPQRFEAAQRDYVADILPQVAARTARRREGWAAF